MLGHSYNINFKSIKFVPTFRDDLCDLSTNYCGWSSFGIYISGDHWRCCIENTLGKCTQCHSVLHLILPNFVCIVGTHCQFCWVSPITCSAMTAQRLFEQCYCNVLCVSCLLISPRLFLFKAKMRYFHFKCVSIAN